MFAHSDFKVPGGSETLTDADLTPLFPKVSIQAEALFVLALAKSSPVSGIPHGTLHCILSQAVLSRSAACALALMHMMAGFKTSCGLADA